MFTVTKYPQGTFSWADCMTSDAAAGKQFYADLMGWEINAIPMGEDMFYYMFQQEGPERRRAERHAAGHGGHPALLEQLHQRGRRRRAWCRALSELGGKVMGGPWDVFDSGRMVTLQGPDEAVVSLWQPRNHIGAGLVNTPGALCWNELYTKDPEVSKAFYGALLGWSFMAHPDTPGYSMIQNKGRMNGGVFTMDDEMSAVMPPMWMPYFSVADIEAAAERVVELGGSVFIGPQPAGDVGTFILFTDPQGAHCYLIQLSSARSLGRVDHLAHTSDSAAMWRGVVLLWCRL